MNLPGKLHLDDEDDGIVTVLANIDDEIALGLIVCRRLGRRRSRLRRESVVGRKKTRERIIQLGHESIMRAYLGLNPVYDETLFQLRYRMRADVVGKMGASPEQKVTAALRMLGNGTSADGQDEYCRVSESTVMKSFSAFCKSIVDIYGKEKIAQRHYRGKEGPPTVVPEAIVTADRWIWYAFFGIPGIYPARNTFISAFVEPTNKSKQAFTKDRMQYVIYCCIILHNMIIQLRGEGEPENLPDPYGTMSTDYAQALVAVEHQHCPGPNGIKCMIPAVYERSVHTCREVKLSPGTRQ
ncbi:hypothetical protein PC119_g22585 [Phytophthora cactorum]|nr:hypothetical protein PC112_g20850 [Phytophthora cactorum]KAG2799973.1 hypothetical protein PC111_g20179 [Phytophthora cactorum]KAG2974851.1 hypothetical protein PC119_g22585 [Phytophthora cactorum]